MNDGLPMDPSRLNPYDDEYPTCQRTLAELRVGGDELDPDRITELLGITPTLSRKKGDVATNSLGRQRTAKLGVWILSSGGQVESKDLRRHLDWLLAVLAPAAKALHMLQKTSGVRMSVACIWWSAYGDGGPTLWPEQMRALAELNLECSFQIAFYREHER